MRRDLSSKKENVNCWAFSTRFRVDRRVERKRGDGRQTAKRRAERSSRRARLSARDRVPRRIY